MFSHQEHSTVTFCCRPSDVDAPLLIANGSAVEALRGLAKVRTYVIVSTAEPRAWPRFNDCSARLASTNG